TPDSYFCTTVRVDGSAHSDSNTSSTVRQCNDNPFKTDCATIPEFNAGRISICTTPASIFNAGCDGDTYGEVTAARASLVASCATTPGGTGCDLRVDGSAGNGPTIDTCNATPFETGCDTNAAFEAGRMSVCTTDATSFTAGCDNGTYDGTTAAQMSFAEDCADGIVTTGCDTTYINGADGTSVEDCNANPFLTDCAAIGSFASAQTARTNLCSPTNDPFNTACEIANFADNNDANRDTYCQNTALPAAGATDGHCEDRKTEICVTTTATATYNPFAPLCRDDSGIAGLRDTFCNLGEQSANTNCGADAAVLCAANPFGTKLGTAATIDCTTGNTYDGNRKAVVDACRNGDTVPGGATCTVAINNCNANPFNPTAFSGSVCDAAAFADAQVAYCVKPANAWHADCDALDMNTETVQQARGDVCVNNLAITGATANDVAAGMSLFHADCAGETATDGTTVVNARLEHCKEPANAWQNNCNSYDTGETNANAEVAQARDTICLNNGAILKGAAGGAGDVAAGQSLFHGDCTGSTLTV
ncbi:MAG: hypothetical protein K8953_02885, partial [Proteobacteria bacterium]|nr:hypothetical protein [Pseudomonadota bacterium]